MQENLKDILGNLSTEVDQEMLLLYLQGHLSAEQQHRLEKQMTDNDFAADAFEGLQKIKDKGGLPDLVAQLNCDLKKKTAHKNSRRRRRQIKSDPWLLISIAIILLLIVISYFIIYKQVME